MAWAGLCGEDRKHDQQRSMLLQTQGQSYLGVLYQDPEHSTKQRRELVTAVAEKQFGKGGPPVSIQC